MKKTRLFGIISFSWGKIENENSICMVLVQGVYIYQINLVFPTSSPIACDCFRCVFGTDALNTKWIAVKSIGLTFHRVITFRNIRYDLTAMACQHESIFSSASNLPLPLHVRSTEVLCSKWRRLFTIYPIAEIQKYCCWSARHCKFQCGIHCSRRRN